MTAYRVIQILSVVFIATLVSGLDTTQEWMALTRPATDSYTLFDFVLPGTHNSASYNLTHTLAHGAINSFPEHLRSYLKTETGLNIMRKWAQCQSFTVYEQLRRGIRYLDIRACRETNKENPRFVACHTLLGEDLDVVFGDVRRFLDESTQEIVVMHIGEFSGFSRTENSHMLLASKIESIFGGLILTPEIGLNRTYIELIEMGKRLVVLYDRYPPPSAQFFPADNVMRSSWSNTDKPGTLMQRQSVRVESQTRDPHKLYQVQWVLTPSSDTIFKSVTGISHMESLRDLAMEANAGLREFWDKSTRYQFHFIIVDYFETSDVVTLARAQNRLNCLDNISARGKQCREWRAKGRCRDLTIVNVCQRTCEECPKKLELGDTCSNSEECLFGNCYNGVCYADRAQLEGSVCSTDFDCSTGACCDSQCCVRAEQTSNLSNALESEFLQITVFLLLLLFSF